MSELLALSRDFPFVEWGVLQRAGTLGAKHRRYLAAEDLRRIVNPLRDHGLQAALHLCGGLARTFLAHADSGHWPADWAEFMPSFARVQLNMQMTAEHTGPVDALAELPAEAQQGTGDCAVIVQWNRHNTAYWAALAAQASSGSAASAWPACLVDASGGRGLAPMQWPNRAELLPTAMCYAGGLSAERLPQEWPRLLAAADGLPEWLDLETALRDEQDAFCVRRCAQVLETVARLLAA